MICKIQGTDFTVPPDSTKKHHSSFSPPCLQLKYTVWEGEKNTVNIKRNIDFNSLHSTSVGESNEQTKCVGWFSPDESSSSEGSRAKVRTKVSLEFHSLCFWIETGVKDGTDHWVTVAEPPFGHKSIGSDGSLRQNAAEAALSLQSGPNRVTHYSHTDCSTRILTAGSMLSTDSKQQVLETIF